MENIDFYQITVYLGILGFLCITFSFLSGLRIIKPKAKLRLHKRVGIAGFIIVAIHAFTMMYFTLFS